MEKTLNLKLTLGNQLLSKDFPLNDNQLIVLSSPSLAEQTFNQLKKEINSDNLHLLPHTETLPYDFFSPSANLKNERMKTLSKLILPEKIMLDSSVQSLMSPCADKNHLMPINTLIVKDKLNRNKFLQSLVSSGYTKTELVSEVGEFSVRGMIIDIFPTGSRFPVRIEIYEDNKETIKIEPKKSVIPSILFIIYHLGLIGSIIGVIVGGFELDGEMDTGMLITFAIGIHLFASLLYKEYTRKDK